MTTNLYALRDLKAECYVNIFDDLNDQTAIRKLAAIAQQNPEAQIIKFKEDYQLYRIGTFDQKSGSIIPEVHHVVDLYALVGDVNG